jgi:biopolymer transport protein ExbD
MLGADNNKYVVPVNYASKSKLVQGDRMKLTIEGSGKMLYKQIKQIDRETRVGLLTQDKGRYQVVSDGVSYDVLTAAVTHFKADIGDNVTVLIPAGKEATFGAIEAVMPKG